MKAAPVSSFVKNVTRNVSQKPLVRVVTDLPLNVYKEILVD